MRFRGCVRNERNAFPTTRRRPVLFRRETPPRSQIMTFVLYRKLLRDVRTPLIAVSLLLFGFAGLWVRVTQQVTTQISPLLALAGQKQGMGPNFFHNLFFRGPGKLIQTFLGGEDVQFLNPQDTLAIVSTHPLVQAV